MPGLIDPKDRIAEFTVEELCATADKPFAEITDPTPLMAKPFGNPSGAPNLLYLLGILFDGLRLGRTMRVLDFGAGTCWLSRCLAQLGCATVAVDPSPAALAIGKRLFAEYPPVGGCIVEPQFLLFDGYRIDLPDASVDRVVCFDSFHHIPNQRTVIAEFHRVLKPGGMAGFAEPGRHHSRSPASQYEMREHKVLENDIVLKDIWAFAREAGFTELEIKHALVPQLSIPWSHYHLATGRGPLSLLLHPGTLFNLVRYYLRIIRSLPERAVFLLHKGPVRLDTRNSFVALGGSPELAGTGELSYRMTSEQREIRGRAGESVRIPLRIANTGSLTWLHDNILDYALVKVGGHLLRADGSTVDHDFLHSRLPEDVPPGGELSYELRFDLPAAGRYTLVLDLLSEQIVWFEALGSTPVRLSLVAD